MRTVAILSAFLLGCGTAPFDPDAGTADSGMPHRACEDDFDCLNGFRCNLNFNLCEPISDAGTTNNNNSDAGTDSSTNNNNSDAGNDSGMPDSGADIDSGSPNFALNLEDCEAEIPNEIRGSLIQPGDRSLSGDFELRFNVSPAFSGDVFSRIGPNGQTLTLSFSDEVFNFSINGTSVEFATNPGWNEVSISYRRGDGFTVAVNAERENVSFSNFRWSAVGEIFFGGNGFIGMIDNIQFINFEGGTVGRWTFDDETLNDSSGNEHHMMSDCGFVER